MSSAPEPECEGEEIAYNLVPTENVSGDDEQDTVLLRNVADEAKQYISTFEWCDAVLDSYFGGGVGGIFAVFFFHIRSNRPEVDPWIWIVVGDIPPAYLPIADCKSPGEVFRTYVDGMSRWVELARKGQRGTAEQGVPPLNVPATPEWAEKLNQKLNGLTFAIKPIFEDESHSVN
jgi:hypothetical protein